MTSRWRWGLLLVAAIGGGVVGSLVDAGAPTRYRTEAGVATDLDTGVLEALVAEFQSSLSEESMGSVDLDLSVETGGRVVVSAEHPRPVVAATTANGVAANVSVAIEESGSGGTAETVRPARIPEHPVRDESVGPTAAGALVALFAVAAVLWLPRPVASRGHSAGAVLAERLFVQTAPDSPAARRIEDVAASLLGGPDRRGLRSVLVTSVCAGGDSGDVAANLAVAFAHRDRDVLLVDEDDVSHGVRELLDLPVGNKARLPLPGCPPLTCVAHAGPTWLSGRDVPTLEGWLRGELVDHDLVLIHGAPLEASDDAVAWGAVVDAVLVVEGRPAEEDHRVRARREQLSKHSPRVASLWTSETR